jgi:hypothetical protein
MDRMPGVNDCDSFADAYTAETDAGITNAYYERPAMLELARRRRGPSGGRPG